MSANLIPITGMSVLSTRQRQEFKAQPLEELEASIRARGLLQPLVVRKNEHGIYVLVAGERRLRAIRRIYEQEIQIKHGAELLPLGHVPVIDLGDIEKLEAIEAEFAENAYRLDLTWQERVSAVNTLHRLRYVQQEEHNLVHIMGGEPERVHEHSKQDTAKELAERRGVPLETAKQAVSRATIIAEHLDDEEIAKAPNESQAFRLVMEKLEKKLGFAMLEDPEPEDGEELMVSKLFLGRMEDVLPKLPDGAYDCIVTDPPYGVGVEDFGDAASRRHGYSESGHIELHQKLFEFADRKLTPCGHMYIFCDIELFPMLHMSAESYGFLPRRVPIIWDKGPSGHLDSGGVFGFRRNYELIFHCRRPDGEYRKLMDDVLRYPNPSLSRFHAAQKPTDLYLRLIMQSCLIGDMVLDPFAGSGPIFSAAKTFGVTAHGVEADAEMAMLTSTRRGVKLIKDLTNE